MPLPQTPTLLQEGLWSLFDWTRDHGSAFSKEGANPNNSIETMPEDNTKPSSYYGPAKDRPRLTFNSFKDVLLGDFVFCLPYHNNYLLVGSGGY